MEFVIRLGGKVFMNNKRIGILTHYYGSNNYGGILQAYALCRKLNLMGYSAEQICYPLHEPMSLQELSKRLNRNMSLEKILTIVPRKILYITNNYKNSNILLDRYKSFSEFREKSIPHSKELYLDSTIANCVDDYDIFITGSDQVWNPIWFRKGFFLDFVPKKKKKIAYAASIGQSTLTNEQRTLMKHKLADFYAISVREKSSVKLLSEITGCKIEWVLDPTMLLPMPEWDAVCSEQLVAGPYILCYFLGNGLLGRKMAEQFAMQHKLSVVNIPMLGKYNKLDGFGDIKLCNASPNDFISLIKYADCIFTDSFHACVFSILYRKQFYAFNRDDGRSMISRIESILEIIHGEKRLIEDSNLCGIAQINDIAPIDYTGNREKLMLMRQKSESFLIDNL